MTKSGLIWVGIGLLLICISQLHNPFLFIANWFLVILYEFLINMGLAFIIMGVVTISLGFKGWQSYFKARLKDIVIEKNI